jgi:tubulin polyglutamylase TTLL5
MQHFRGFKHFDIVPQTFLLPADYKELVFAHNKNKGPWIVKPVSVRHAKMNFFYSFFSSFVLKVASSRGRGIFLAKTPDEIQSHIASDEQVVAARYISDPLQIDGHKCDIRIYAAVTSFDPLIIYVYEEGLVRIATVRYDNNADNLWNPCMHLCNYSINKFHSDYIRSNNAGDEDVGHKWTLSALLRHLRNQGCNTEQLMLNIEDIIIKAIFACTQPIVSACRMFVNHFSNCFELFGFDILIDDTLKPWLIEVNLSPSLGCDSPLDTKVKASLLTDLLTLVGIPAISPLMKASMDNKGVKIRSLSNNRRVNSADFVHNAQGQKKPILSTLTAEEIKIVKSAKGQMERRGGFVRIFPAPDSMQKYGMFLDPVTGIPTAASTSSGNGTYLMIIPHNYNQMLFTQLFSNDTTYHETILDRIQKYERTLDRSLPIIIGPKSSSTKSQDETRRMKLQIRKLIENGDELSTFQARKAFSLYLEHVLKRLSTDGKHTHEEYIMKFLHRIAIYMRQPFFIRNVTHNRIMVKERGAMVAKLLGDYLHLYNKDTEAFSDAFDRVGMVPSKLFDDFLSHAQELEIESVLTLHTNITQTMPFLYNNYSPGVPAAPPIPVGPHGFLKSLCSMAPGSHVRDVWRSDLGKNEKAPTKVHNKKAEKPGKLSPIKKKVTLYSTSKLKDRDRSSWLYN